MGLWKVVSLGGRVAQRMVVCVLGLLAMINLGSTVTMTVSLLISLAVYAMAFGVKFAAGFVILLFIHELGHWGASRIVGLRATTPLFIPFVGAVISLNKAPINAKMEANVAIGGPALGVLSALLCLAVYFWTDSILLLVLAYTACLLNLFNLIPCDPLDGGRIAAAISPHMWWVGSIIIGVVFFYTYNFFILIIFLFSLFRLWQGEEAGAHYYNLSIGQRVKVAWWYFGLLAVLGVTTLHIVELLR